MFEDAKKIIWIRKSKNDRQHNGWKKKNWRANNYLQNTTIHTKRLRTSSTRSQGWTHVLREGNCTRKKTVIQTVFSMIWRLWYPSIEWYSNYYALCLDCFSHAMNSAYTINEYVFDILYLTVVPSLNINASVV
jgi:hypothetical protein